MAAAATREAGVGGCPLTPPVFLGYLFERPDESEQPFRDASPVPPADPAGAEIIYFTDTGLSAGLPSRAGEARDL